MIEEDIHLQAFTALRVLREATVLPATAITASRIVAYARRGDTPADLQVERAMRASPAARQLYSMALGKTVPASALSVAAAADQVTERRVGDWHLEILDEAGGPPWLIIRAPVEAPPIGMIELRRPDGSGRRVDLGMSIDGVFQLPLDPGFEELAELIVWLRDPTTAIYLL